MSDQPDQGQHRTPADLIYHLMRQHGWTQRDLADLLGRPSQVVSEILTGKKSVTAYTALQLEAATGVDAEQFLILQIRVNLEKARQGYKSR